ncbi:hypothetical protein GCM10012275_20090 [Longimycelium tulufanense]|uniref:Carrier domain-containing protein n=1 Tax=Longimycelium tulufanense TaxID=907463 RepID=A0A8J3FTF5_9PSEU|nr:phosphopantetheine-binding protein [Longimycelium tulufanense]GGM49179.1 hypothetical protein GCM10012275_20090 [Longimycelium tulufanense]
MPDSHDSLTWESLRGAVAEILNQPSTSLAEDDNLLEAGLDSIRMMSLVEQWRHHGIEVTFVELAEHPTLRSWATLLGVS